MDLITPTLIAVGVVNLLMFPVLAWFIKRGIGKKLDAMDEKRELARRQRETEVEDRRVWREAMERGMRAILRAEIVAEHRKWTGRGYCSLSSKDYITRLASAYHGLGGNDVGDALYGEIMELPTESDHAPESHVGD